jgi:N6-adenosine-specific RNA methylase IME4
VLGAFGRPKIISKSVRSVIMAPVREHSRKPDQAFEAARALIPYGRAAEVFSRQSRSGWDVFGDEAAKFNLESNDGYREKVSA